MKRWVLWLWISSFSMTGYASDLVGTVVPPYPKGLDSISGFCLSSTEQPCRYGISIVENRQGEETGIILKRTTRLRDTDPNRWLVMDYLPYPEYTNDFILTIGTCYLDGQYDDSIIAVVENTDTEVLKVHDWVWTVDFSSEKFSRLTPEQLEQLICYNEGWEV